MSKKTRKSGQDQERLVPLSLSPLSSDDALKGAMEVPPPPEDKPKKNRKSKRKKKG